MSEIKCEVLRLGQVKPHPNADKLEIAEVLGTQCIVPKGAYRSGMGVVWIPPGILLGKEAIEFLGVGNYLKEAIYPVDLVATKCRVAACRLRGEVREPAFAHAGVSLLAGAEAAEFRAHEATLLLTGGRHYNILTSTQSDSRSVSGPRLRTLR